MIPELREGVLKVEGAAQKEEEDGVDVEEKSESENTIDTGYQSEDNKDNDKDTDTNDKELEIKRYQISVLNQIQFIFGHLAQSQLQFHVPQGFWKTFKWVHLAFFGFFLLTEALWVQDAAIVWWLVYLTYKLFAQWSLLTLQGSVNAGSELTTNYEIDFIQIRFHQNQWWTFSIQSWFSVWMLISLMSVNFVWRKWCYFNKWCSCW